MNVKYRVDLDLDERGPLIALSRGGRIAVRRLKRVQILLADAGVDDDSRAECLGLSGSTISHTKRRFLEQGLEAPLSEQPRPGGARKLSGQHESLLVATACAGPLKGRNHWTLTLLADAMVRLTEHDGLPRETVRRRLAEDALKPWRRDMWWVPEVDGAYVACMDDVLDLYAEDPDPRRPVICSDESLMQLIGEARQSVPAAPGQPIVGRREASDGAVAL